MYYDTIQKMGYVLTPEQAQRWSTAVLKTLGLELSRKAKKRLKKALPAPLAQDLYGVFRIIHFRNKALPREEFLEWCGRRAGATDPINARHPVRAVFHGLKDFLDDETIQVVADGLAPEISQMWQEA